MVFALGSRVVSRERRVKGSLQCAVRQCPWLIDEDAIHLRSVTAEKLGYRSVRI
jgi:hypothetical protein